jgi:hypothetical protein
MPKTPFFLGGEYKVENFWSGPSLGIPGIRDDLNDLHTHERSEPGGNGLTCFRHSVASGKSFYVFHRQPPLGGSYFEITISTRRFFCRPAGSSLPSGFTFGATGFAAPKPRVVIAVFKPSFETSHSFTDAARCSERPLL